MSSVVLATAGYGECCMHACIQPTHCLHGWPCCSSLSLPSPHAAPVDHTVRFWEATSGICYRTLQYADSQVNKLEITADKTQIAAAGNPQIRVFDVNSNDPQPLNSYDGHNGNVTAVGFQKDSKWMFSGRHRPPPWLLSSSLLPQPKL